MKTMTIHELTGWPLSIAKVVANNKCQRIYTRQFYEDLPDEEKAKLTAEQLRGKNGRCQIVGCKGSKDGPINCRSVCIKCTIKNFGFPNQTMLFICGDECFANHMNQINTRREEEVNIYFKTTTSSNLKYIIL